MKSWTRDLNGQHIWLIGASSGIGAELARVLVKRGAKVAITGRRKELLDEVAGGEMIVAAVDVTDVKALDAAAADVEKALGGIDTVIMCAAYWKKSDAADWDREVFAQHYEVNILGFNNVLGAVLPTMIKNKHGHIVGIASVAGFRGFPGAEAYGSTKAAQIALLESLRTSFRHKGVRVTTVAPGFVRTELTAVNDFPMPFLIDVDEAAESIAKGLERGRVEVVFPWKMAVAMKIARLLPQRWWSAAMGRDLD